MILEITTVAALGGVLLLKFVAVKHANGLSQKRVELANVCQM